MLGYAGLSEAERLHFEVFFAAANMLPLSQSVVEQAVVLRQVRKMSLGDALVAATALVYSMTLVTRNMKDFAWVPGLDLLNPFDAQESAGA